MSHQDDIRRRVTDEIITALKAGTRPWVRPWTDLENTGMPTNVFSEQCYSGVNVLLLMLVGQARGYQSKFWGTFNQWRSLGFQVMRRPDDIAAGQYGTHCVLFKPITKTKKDANGQDEQERFFLLREFVLFNSEQVTGLGIEEYHAHPRKESGFIDYQPAEEVIAATGADIRHAGNRAVYRISEDRIDLPPKNAFANQEYYGTALHELCHWTGHEKRLNRLNKLARFGNDSYAYEELCAEMGAAFLMTELGLPQSEDLSNVTAYLGHWLTVLEKDHTAIFTASSAASKAADFILSFSRNQNDKQEVIPEEAVAP